MAAAEVTYAALAAQAQANVWDTIKNDSGVQAYTSVVLDHAPAGLTGKTGYSFVVVPLPQISESQLTASFKSDIISFQIEVWIWKHSSAPLVDAVRNALSDLEGTYSGTYILHEFLADGDVEYVETEDGRIVQKYTLTVRYEWIGDPAG